MVPRRRLLLGALALTLIVAWTAPVQADIPGMDGPEETFGTIHEAPDNGDDPDWWRAQIEPILEDPEGAAREECRSWLPGTWSAGPGIWIDGERIQLVPNASRTCETPVPANLTSSSPAPSPADLDLDAGPILRTADRVDPGADVEVTSFEIRPGVQDASVPVRQDPADARHAMVVGVAVLAVGAALVVLHRYLSDDEVLDNDLRRRILALVRERPGATPSDVAAALDVHYTTAVYHLETLSEFDHAVERRYGGRRRFFARGTCRTRSALLDALSATGRARIVEHLATAERSSVSEVVDAADLSQSTVSEHLSRLHDQGLVAREREGRRVIYRLTPGARQAMRDRS